MPTSDYLQEVTNEWKTIIRGHNDNAENLDWCSDRKSHFWVQASTNVPGTVGEPWSNLSEGHLGQINSLLILRCWRQHSFAALNDIHWIEREEAEYFIFWKQGNLLYEKGGHTDSNPSSTHAAGWGSWNSSVWPTWSTPADKEVLTRETAFLWASWKSQNVSLPKILLECCHVFCTSGIAKIQSPDHARIFVFHTRWGPLLRVILIILRICTSPSLRYLEGSQTAFHIIFYVPQFPYEGYDIRLFSKCNITSYRHSTPAIRSAWANNSECWQWIIWMLRQWPVWSLPAFWLCSLQYRQSFLWSW